MSTLADISKATNLGLATVSDILRHKPGYSDKTRQRVLEAARKLHYRPNLIGQALQRGRTQSIGVLMGSFNTPIHVTKLAAIEEAARMDGYACYASQLAWNLNRKMAEAVIQGLLARRVDGLIVHLGSPPREPALELLQSADVPTVHLDWAPPEARYHVAINRRAGIEAAAAHLARLGHRRARYLATPSDVHSPLLKFDFYRNALKRHGIELEGAWEQVLEHDTPVARSAYELIGELIRTHRLPTALLMSNDDAALGAIAALTDAGLRVPGDVSVVGFDDLPHAAWCRPSITTIRQPRGEAGETAYRMLRGLLAGQEPEQSHVELNCRLVERQSTGPASDFQQEHL